MGTSFADRLEARRLDRAHQEGAVKDVETPQFKAPSDLPFAERMRQHQLLREQGIHTQGPPQVDRDARRQFLAEGVGQEKLGPPGFPNLAARADIALSEKFDEKKAKFLDKFPDGDFLQVQDPAGGTTVLFRRNQDEDFAEFDPPALDSFEAFGDLADLSGEIPAIAMEIFITRGRTLGKQLFQIFLGNVAGESAKEITELARGYQRETFGDLAERTVEKGLAAVAGGALTVGVSGPVNALRGAANIKVAPGARVAQRAAKELSIPPLMPNQVATSPLIRKIGGQAGATVSSMSEYIARQQAAAVRSMFRLRDEYLSRFLRGDLENLHNDARNQVIAFAKNPGVDLRTGGLSVQQGIAEYDELATSLVNRLYMDARNIQSPIFDMTGVRAVADDLETGVRTALADGGTQRVSELSSGLSKIIQEIKAADPSLPDVALGGDKIATATDQLRAWRSRLWDLKTPNPGEISRQEQKQAGKLYAAITHALKNPQNADSKFLSAWAKANTEAAKRFDTMEKLLIVQASKSETPTILADRLAKPLQADNLKLLKETIPQEKYRVFQQSAITKFLRDPDTITKQLDTFDRETLDLLFFKTDQEALREVGTQVDRLNRLGIDKIIERQTRTSTMVNELIDRSDTASIDELVARAKPNKKFRDTLRAAIMEDVIKKSTVTVENATQINAKGLRTQLERLRASGAIKLLTANDVHVLKNLNRVAEFIPSGGDTGTSIQAASTAAGLRELNISAMVTLLETIGTGRMFTSELGQRLLIGAGAEKLPFTSLRLVGAILGQVASEAEGN